MSSYLAHASTIQLPRQELLATFIARFSGRREARQAAKAQQDDAAYLNSLDRAVLDDIGIDPETLPVVRKPLLSFHPGIVATTLFAIGNGRKAGQ